VRIALIAGMTFREAARKRVLWIALAAGAAFLALFGTALHFQARDLLTTRVPSAMRAPLENFLLMMGLYAADLLTVMMAVVVSADVISGEIASGTIQAIATRPIARWEFFGGKWLGCVLMVTLYLGLMIGGTAGLGWWIAGARAEHPIAGLALIWLESALVVTLTLLCGATFSALASAVLVLGLHGLAFLGGWIEQAGALLGSQRMVLVGIIASVVMPSEALWRRAVFEMQSPVTTAMRLGPFAMVSVPSEAMVGYAAVYLALAFALALLRFSRRDL
jgi:Cu-processing system permease protein